MTRLARSELLLFVLLALHTVDHAVNQPARDLPAGSGLVGIAGFALVAIAIVFALCRSRYAAPVGLFAGLGTLAGFVVVHIPGVGPLADPFVDFDPNALSWMLLAAPILVLGLGRRQIANGDRPGPAGSSVHPVSPRSSRRACGRASAIASPASAIAFGLPGKLTISARPRTPARLRASIQCFVCSREASRIASARPGASRSPTARVASGVTSSGARPVPPVVRIRSQRSTSASRRRRSSIVFWESGRELEGDNLCAEVLGEARPTRLRSDVLLDPAARELLMLSTAAAAVPRAVHERLASRSQVPLLPPLL